LRVRERGERAGLDSVSPPRGRLRAHRACRRRGLHEGRTDSPLRHALTASPTVACVRPPAVIEEPRRTARLEGLALAAILVLAALLRLPGLAERGRFDADQGGDMATLAAFTRDGDVPLLGPKTSVGEFHHGAFYYFLLAPAAAVSDDDPVAVTA